MNDMSTTTHGVLAVMDAEIACLPIMAEMMTGHDGDAFDAKEAVRRMAEARATVERLIDALSMVDRIWTGDQTANIDPESPLAKVRAVLAEAGAR